MKHLMWGLGLNPLVIPNGIPPRLLRPVRDRDVRDLRAKLAADLLLATVARWDPAKGWDEAIDAVSRMPAVGWKTTLVSRVGSAFYGVSVMQLSDNLLIVG